MQTKIPPPVWLLIIGAVMWLVAHSAYAYSIHIPFSLVLAIVIGVLGVLCSASALRLFRSADTTVNPLKPEEASSLVTNGIYAKTRNPMYVGLSLVLIGWAVWLGSLSNIVVLVLFVVVITELQIKPEEAALRELFGQEYRDYCQQVRRWI